MILDMRGRESLIDVIVRESARAPGRELRLLLAASVLGVAVCAAAPLYWSVLAWAGTALFVATACLALGELCRRAPAIPAMAASAVQSVLVTIGLFAGLLGGFALLLAVLGDPWQL